MTDLTLFTFENHELRIVDQAGEPWFVLKDVLSAMGTTRTTAQAVASIKQHLGDGYINDIPILDTLGRMQSTTIAAEPAVTFLVSRGNTDDSRRLNRFIHVEALPSIRKTGGYSINPPPAADPAAATPTGITVEMSLEQFARIAAPLLGMTIRPTPISSPAPIAGPAKPAPRPVTEEERVKVLELYTSGQSIRAISRAMGRSHSTIQRILDQANADADPQIALRLLDGGAS
jgi:prophage antirepressor-like protein